MLEPHDMTEFQKITSGLKIIQEYLSKKNPGTISAEHDEIWAGGVPDHVMGGDDLASLKAMGWEWSPSYLAWRFQL